MGVLGLWSIIEGGEDATSASAAAAASSPVSLALSSLVAAQAASSGPARSLSEDAFTPRLLAVDLSVWLMEAHPISRCFETAAAGGPKRTGSAAGSFVGGPMKHHLLYIFQRACAFLRQSVRLLFVTDGRAPAIKSRLATKGNQVGAAAASGGTAHRGQNPLYAAQVRDCAKLLELMDLPLLVLVRGEAEALCGALNARGACDGVLTPDGDCLLFGGRVLLRNLEASQSTLAARVVHMSRIERSLGFDRHRLVLLALMLGSDYTSGVRGLGPRKAVKFVRILDACLKRFESAQSSDDPPPSARPAPEREHAMIRLFRALIQTATPDEGIRLILSYHAEAGHTHSSSSTVASSSALFAAASSSPSSSMGQISYSTMALADLKLHMAQHGLKPQSKLIMIAKLQQIQSLSPASTPSPLSAAAPASVSPFSSSILLSDSGSDSEDEEAAGRSKRPKGRGKAATAANKSRVSMQTFLTTYFTKIHARYHEAPNRAEMEHILDSYLRPTLQPTVDQMEKQIPQRIPNPSNFLALRSFCANEMKITFVKFEKLWLPTLMHLDLWRRQEGDQLKRRHDEVEDDLVMQTPPPSRSNSAVTVPLSGSSSTAPCHSGSSTVMRTNSSSSLAPAAAAAFSSSLQAPSPLYTFSHLSKRRVIQGVAYFVLIWSKTDRGRREVASLPADIGSPAPQAGGAQSNDAADELEDEVDMTASPLVATSPVPSAAASSESTIATPAVKKSLPIQATDVNLFETYEPAVFLAQCLSNEVAEFEAHEREQVRLKDQAKTDKELAKADKEQARAVKEKARVEKAAAKERKKALQDDGDDEPAKPKAKRGRKKKEEESPSFPITLFMSPVVPSAATVDPIPKAVKPTAVPEPRPSAPVTAVAPKKSAPKKNTLLQNSDSDDDEPMIDLVTPSPPPSVTTIPPKKSSTLPLGTTGMLPFKSSKLSIYESMQAPLDTRVVAILTHTVPSAAPSIFSKPPLAPSSSDASSKRHQSTLLGFVKTQSKTVQTTASVIVEEKSSSVVVKTLVSEAADEDSFSSFMAEASSEVSSFSSTLSMCPLCDRAFSVVIIGSHVNSCLDQQQLRADEKMARGFSGGLDQQPSVKAQPAASLIDEASGDEPSDDDFDLDDEMNDELVLVPDAPCVASSPLRLSKKRKSEPAEHPPPRPSPSSAFSSAVAAASTVAAASSIDEVAFVPPPPASRPPPSGHRTLITLIDSDEEDEPGSTIYVKQPRAPPQPVKSIFSR